MNLESIKAALTDNFLILRDELRRKGVAYYKTPLIVLALGMVSLYTNVYQGADQRQKAVKLDITSVKAQSAIAGTYGPAKAQEIYASRRLPKFANKDWLSKTVQKIFDEENVVPRSMGTPTEAESEHYTLVTMNVALMPIPFSTLAKILVEIENSPLLIKITSCDIVREQGTQLGQPLVGVTLTVSTVVPK